MDYLFMVRYDEDGVHLDTFYNYTKAQADVVAEKLEGESGSKERLVAAQVHGLMMRARFNNLQVYKVNFGEADEELDPDVFEGYLKGLQKQGLLKDWLVNARVPI